MPIRFAVTALARLFAILGGVCLAAITVMTVASVAGRALIVYGLGPIPGDFELVEAGMAFAVFAFLPWCHLQRGNVSVEIFTSGLGPAANRLIDAVCDTLMLGFALLLAWQHFLGTLDKMANGETTFILQFPVWWGYAAAMTGVAVLVIVAVYCFIRSWAAVIAGAEPQTEGGGGA